MLAFSNDYYGLNFRAKQSVELFCAYAIILRLDRVMADRKISLNDLSEKVGIANVNLSKIKTGKVSAIRFSTLNAICKALDCQPGDILEYQEDTEE